jgi:hypothetical protein
MARLTKIHRQQLPSVAQSEIVHAFLEGTTSRDLVRELERSPPIDSNELFDITTSFASREEVVGAIFDGKKGKHVDDAPAEGSKSKVTQKKQNRARKARSPTVTRIHKGATTTMTRLSLSTLPVRALKPPLEAPACWTTC